MTARESTATDLRENTYTIAGQNILVKEFGEGPPLLLIHGFLVSSDEWREVIPYLAKDFRCIALDLPGFGRSAKPSASDFDYTLSGYASLIADLLVELDVAPCFVAGHSMGGAIAMQLAIEHPQTVSRLVVMDAAWHPFSMPLKARPLFMGKVGELVFKKLYGRALFRDYFKNDVYNGNEVDPEQVDAYYDEFNTTASRNAAYVVMQNIVHPSNLARLATRVREITQPTLVLWGEDDHLIPVSLADKLVRELPDATLHLLKRCGHAGNEEQPEATAAAFRQHFQAESATQAPVATG